MSTPHQASPIIPPKEFVCPLTNKLMVDPVTNEHGVSFERTAIEEYVKKNEQEEELECPITGLSLSQHDRDFPLMTDTKLRYKIQFWKRSNGVSSATEDESTSSSSTSTIPLKFLCPLSLTLMEEPVLTVHGQTYEKANILKWIEMNGEICPLTYEELKLVQIIPNLPIQNEIKVYKMKEQQEEKKTATTTSSDNNVTSQSKTNTTVVQPTTVSQKLPQLENVVIGNANNDAVVRGFLKKSLATLSSSSNHSKDLSDDGAGTVTSLDGILTEVQHTLERAKAA